VCCLVRFFISFCEKKTSDEFIKFFETVKKGLAKKCLPTNALDEFAKRIPGTLFEKQALQGQEGKVLKQI